eukprot:jgi/Mesen1/1203/ME000128S00186
MAYVRAPIIQGTAFMRGLGPSSQLLSWSQRMPLPSFRLITPHSPAFGTRHNSSTRVSAHTMSAQDDSEGRIDTIQWDANRVNSIHLTGRLGMDPQMKHLAVGLLASTSLAVNRPAAPGGEDTTDWFQVEAWQELAEVMGQQLKKGMLVQVSGSLRMNTWTDRESRLRRDMRVVARQLKIVDAPPGRSSGAPSSFSAGASAGSSSSSGGSRASEMESLWMDLVSNFSGWYDNRKDKRNPRAPDFKKKGTGEALWIDSRATPGWVAAKLQQLDDSNPGPMLQERGSGGASWGGGGGGGLFTPSSHPPSEPTVDRAGYFETPPPPRAAPPPGSREGGKPALQGRGRDANFNDDAFDHPF